MIPAHQHKVGVLERRLQHLLDRVASNPAKASGWDLREADAIQFALAVLAYVDEHDATLLQKATMRKATLRAVTR
jgi:hypothetical protein